MISTIGKMRAAALALALSFAAPAMTQVVGSDGWMRATPPGAGTAAGYLVLTNTGSEEAKLLKIVSPVSDRTMIHRDSLDSEGVLRMWPLNFLKIPPGETVRFEPNGLHVTFMDLKAPFVAGQKIPLQLTFEGQPEITVMLEVRSPVPDAAMDHSTMRKDQH